MRFSSIFGAGVLVGLVSALPNPIVGVGNEILEARAVAAGCLPNYQGADLYISSTTSKARWTVKTLTDGATLKSAKGAKDSWRIERTGFPQEDFIIKAGRVSDNSLVAKPFKAANLALGTIQGSGNPSYAISCMKCMDPGQWPTTGVVLASGCTIIDTSTGLYVSEAGKGGALVRKAKGKKQKWDMIAI